MNIGDKVVCIDANFPESVREIYLSLPKEGGVYVVRAVRVGVKADERIMDERRELALSLLLVGITNPTNHLGVEHGFQATRFRRLEEMQEVARRAITQEET